MSENRELSPGIGITQSDVDLLHQAVKPLLSDLEMRKQQEQKKVKEPYQLAFESLKRMQQIIFENDLESLTVQVGEKYLHVTFNEDRVHLVLDKQKARKKFPNRSKDDIYFTSADEITTITLGEDPDSKKHFFNVAYTWQGENTQSHNAHTRYGFDSVWYSADQIYLSPLSSNTHGQDNRYHVVDTLEGFETIDALLEWSVSDQSEQ